MRVDIHAKPAGAHVLHPLNLLLFGLMASGLISTTAAEVTLLSQSREVATFTMISYPGQQNPFCTDELESAEPGVFDESVECYVEDGGNSATGYAAQLSYIFPPTISATSFAGRSDSRASMARSFTYNATGGDCFTARLLF